MGSLFSGIGGLDLGLERAGWEVKWQVEKDPFCRRVLAKHWPHVPRWSDITTIEHRSYVDLIAGGFPCQDVSTAGKRKGIHGKRSGLFFELARVVRMVRPKVILLENVPGLLARSEWMGAVLGELAESGYDAEWDCIPAAALGAPHLRDRVFIVAYANEQYDDGRRSGTGKVCGQRSEPTELCGGEHNVADAQSERERSGESGGRDGGGRQLVESTGARGNSDDGGEAMADTVGSGSQEREAQRGDVGEEQSAAERGGGALADADPGGWDGRPRIFGAGGRPESSDEGWWAVEPDVGRVAHGIPSRVDRLRGLGNAVVRQVAEWLGRRILEAMT